MILWNERQWRREMLLCALVFQVIFLVELVGLWEMIVVDPGVHRISYENWGWLINDWQAPAYWENYFLRILSVGSGPELGGTGPLLGQRCLCLAPPGTVRAHPPGHRRGDRSGHGGRPCSSGGTSSITWISTACLCTPSTRSC